jgi:hypothetical protein
MFTDYVKFLTVTCPPTPNQLAAILADVDQQWRPNPGIMQVVNSSPAAAPSPAILDESLKRKSEVTNRSPALSKAIRQRVLDIQESAPKHTSVETSPAPPTKTSRQPAKRQRYEPSAMGQGPTASSRFSASAPDFAAKKHLIVDTGASHVFFREADASILSHDHSHCLKQPMGLSYNRAGAAC